MKRRARALQPALVLDFAARGLAVNMALFVAASFVIAFFGQRLARLADRLADRTGLGEALIGAVLLGASTSLPGVVGTAFAAHAGRGDFVVSHAFGGIAIQTAFLAVVDIFYRRANLEHAAASMPNLVQCVLLLVLLSGALAAIVGPDVSIAGVHPFSVVLPFAYLAGLRLVRGSGERPMWRAVTTRETREDVPSREGRGAPLAGLLWRFAVLAAGTALGGWALVNAAVAIAELAGLSESLVGGVFTTFSSSLPELVTAFSAMRMGALTLAVGNIVGGNVFDCLFLALGDAAYRGGSIYHALSRDTLGLLALALVETALLALGLAYRQPHGFARIGFESVLILVVYTGGVALNYLR